MYVIELRYDWFYTVNTKKEEEEEKRAHTQSNTEIYVQNKYNIIYNRYK